LTRRRLYVVLVLAIIPVVCTSCWGRMNALPGRCAARHRRPFIVGSRTPRPTTARRPSSLDGYCQPAGIVTICRLPDELAKHEIAFSSPAWLTVLRYELRSPRVWESALGSSNAEYRAKFYTVPETETTLEVELAKHLPKDELEQLAATRNKATLFNVNYSCRWRQVFLPPSAA
jgi:putative membrane protein